MSDLSEAALQAARRINLTIGGSAEEWRTWDDVRADIADAMESYASSRVEAARVEERRECIEDCRAEYRDDGTAQRIEARIRIRALSGEPKHEAP